MILFIAEKPSVAEAFAKALSTNFKKKERYIEGDNDFIYSWAAGHLVGLKEPDEINPEYKEWKWEHLPIIPERLYLKALPGCGAQLKTIQELASKATTIINVTDAGMEGELIFHYISLFLQLNKKTIKRVWTSSLQPAAIQKAFKEMKDHAHYQSLRNAAMTRSISDWLIGMNATRAATLAANGKLVRAGRLILPVLAMIYDRHKEREQFKKTKFYPITATFRQQQTTYLGKLYTENLIVDRNLANSIIQAIQHQPAQIKEMIEEEKSVLPPFLMNLTDVSQVANKKHGFRATKTLELLQSLYLKKYITYPRTGSRYITPAEIPLMHRVYNVLSAAYPHLAKGANVELVHEANKRLVDMSKVTDHHGLLPEAVIAADITADEKKVYDILVERFFIQFHEAAKWKTLMIRTKVNDYEFVSNYKNCLSPGWQAIVPKEDDDDEIVEAPNVNMQGQISCIEGSISESETSPLPLFNDASLLGLMENISKRLEDPKLKEILKGRGIGTDATRASTINKLVLSDYITYDKKSLLITKAGITVIEMFRRTEIKDLTSPEFTALWEIQLEDIKNGKSPVEFNSKMKEFSKNIVKQLQTLNISKEEFQESIGICPRCKQNLLQSTKRFYCSDTEECKFFIWRTQYNKTLTINMLNQLLTKGKTGLLTFESSQKKTKYKAKLVLEKTVENGKLELDFTASK